MNHLFANYELSLLAKEKGFKDFCFAGYVEINTKEFQFMMNSQIDSIDEAIGLGDNLITKAPLYQQLCDWFREKHNIHILSDVTFDKKNGNWYYYGIYTKNKLKKYSDGDFIPEYY